MPAEWTDAEIESLSAYIDGQLEESDRTALEARLANDADLRQELAVMRQTVALLRDLPTIRAPRAFTLTPEMVGQTAVPAAAVADIRVLPSQKPRSAQRVWWMPAASAAAVVLLAGVFVVMQQGSGQTPAPGAVQQGVAVAVTSTAILEGSDLNTIVRESVTQTESLGAASATNEKSSPADEESDAQEDGASVGSTGGQAPQPPRATSLALPTQGQNQVMLTQVDSTVPVAPPIQGQDQVTLTQVEIAAPLVQAVEGQTVQGETRFAPSPTAMLTATTTTEVMDAMIAPMATQMPTASPDPNLYPPAPGGDAGNTGLGGELDPANPEAVAGMDGINTNPQAPGFTVSTVSPIQGTVIAQYNAPVVENAVILAETAAPASSTMQDAPSDTVRTAKEAIWIRWFNVISAWVEQLLGQ